MNSPKSPSPRTSFDEVVLEALHTRADVQCSASYALKNGVDPRLLVSYARGTLSGLEREEAEAMLVQSPWALRRVVVLTKCRQNDRTIGYRILHADHTDPYFWGIRNTGDVEMDLARLLDLVTRCTGTVDDR